MKFNADFFKENQKTILQLVNSPIGGLIRRSLWIDDKKNKVVCITPNAYHVELPNGQYKFTGYTNNQYAEALQKSYRPIWETIHAFDMRFANRYMPAWNLGFDSYSSQPDDTTGVDTFLDSGNPTRNEGSSVNLAIGNGQFRSLIKFDLSSVPAGYVFSDATLSLWTSTDISNNERYYRIYECLRNWVESQATWNIYSTGNNWATAGCGGAGTDYNTTDLGNVLMGANEPGNTEKQFTFTVSGLGNMNKIVASGINYGWVLRADTEVDDGYFFHSSGRTTASQRPKLVATYGTSGGVIFFM